MDEQQKISDDFAEQEFARFTDTMDIDTDSKGMNDEDRKGFEASKRTVLRAIKSGAMVINDDGLPQYTPQRSKDTTVITFHEPTGANLMAMDQAREGANMTKMNKVLGEITKTTPARMAGLKYYDYNVCSSVLSLFLG